MVLEDGDVCEICRCEKDNIQYIFGNVNLFKFMVKQENMLNKCRISIRMILSETLDLFACSNNFRTDAVFYLILQIANSYIYSRNCEKKNQQSELQRLVQVLKHTLKIERMHISK